MPFDPNKKGLFSDYVPLPKGAFAASFKKANMPPPVDPSSGAEALTTIAKASPFTGKLTTGDSLLDMANMRSDVLKRPPLGTVYTKSPQDYWSDLAEKKSQEAALAAPSQTAQGQELLQGTPPQIHDDLSTDEQLSRANQTIQTSQPMNTLSQEDLATEEMSHPESLVTGAIRKGIGGTEVGKTLMGIADIALNPFNIRGASEKERLADQPSEVTKMIGGAGRSLTELGMAALVGPELGLEANAANTFTTQAVINELPNIAENPLDPKVAERIGLARLLGKGFGVAEDFAQKTIAEKALSEGLEPAAQKAAQIGTGAAVMTTAALAEHVIEGGMPTKEEIGQSALTGAGFAMMPRGTKGVPKGLDPAEYNVKLNRVIEAISGQESHGNYEASNTTQSPKRGEQTALGKYQIMDFNLPSFSAKYLGKEYSPEEFLGDPHAQEIVGQGLIADNFAENVKRYGLTDRAIVETAKDHYGRGVPPPGNPTPNSYSRQVLRRFRNTEGTDVPDINTVKEFYQNKQVNEQGENGLPLAPQNVSNEAVASPVKAGDTVTTQRGEETVAAVAENGEVQLTSGEFVGAQDFASGKVKIGQSHETANEPVPGNTNTDLGIQRGEEAEAPVKKLEGATKEAVDPEGNTIVIPSEGEEAGPQEIETAQYRPNPLLNPETRNNAKLASEVEPRTPEEAVLKFMTEQNGYRFTAAGKIKAFPAVETESFYNNFFPKNSGEAHIARMSKPNLILTTEKGGMTLDEIGLRAEEAYPEAFGHYDTEGERNANIDKSDFNTGKEAAIDVINEHFGRNWHQSMTEKLAESHPDVIEARQNESLDQQGHEALMLEAHFGKEPIPPEALSVHEDIPLIEHEDAIPEHLVPIIEEYRNDQTGHLDHERLARDIGLANENSTGILKDIYEHKEELQRLTSGRAEEALPRTTDSLPPEPNPTETFGEPETKSTEAGAEEPRITSVKNETAASEREQAGLPPVEPTEVKPDEVTFRNAEKKIKDDPNYSSRLIDELGKGKRTPTDEEITVLGIEQAKRVKEVNDAYEHLNAHPGDEDAKTRVSDAQEALNKITTVTKETGAEQARAFRARQFQTNVDDFSFAGIARRKQALENEGRTLSEDQIKEVQAAHEKIQAMQQKLDEANAAITDAHVNSLLSGITNEIGRERAEAKKSGKKYLEFTGARAAKSQAYLKDYFSSLHAETGIPNPKVAAALLDIGIDKIARGISNLADWTKEMVKTLGEKVRPYLTENLFNSSQKAHEALSFEKGVKRQVTSEDVIRQSRENSAAGNKADPRLIYKLARAFVQEGVPRDEVLGKVHQVLAPLHEGLTERNVRDIFSGYGKTVQPSQAEDLRTLRELRRLSQLKSAVEDVLSGKAPLKSGQQRDKPTIDVREAMKNLRAEMDKAGFETSNPKQQLASRLQAAKTRMNNAIEDIQKYLDTGIKSQSKRKPIEYDAEAKSLQNKLAGLREEANLLDTAHEIKPSGYDVQVARTLKAIQKSIDYYNDLLAGGAKKIKGTSLTTEETEALREKRDELRKQYNDLNAEPELSPEEKRVNARKTRLTNEIESLNQQIEAGVRNPKRTTSDVYDDETKRLILERDAKKEELNQIAPVQGRSPSEQLASWTKQLQQRTEQLKAKLEAAKTDPSVYAPKVKGERVLDENARKALADYERAKFEVNSDIEKRRLANRTPNQKFWDNFVNYRVMVGALSSPITLLRLGVAAVSRLGFTPMEEVVGGLYSAMFPELAAKAPREGGFSMKAEIAAMQGIPEGLKDTWQNMHFKPSDLEVLHKEANLAPPSPLDYIAFLHNAAKAPVVHAEFNRSLTKRNETAEKQGLDPKEPGLKNIIEAKAWNDAMRAKFQQDNLVAKIWQLSLNAAARSKQFPTYGPGLARAMRVLLPVVKIPTNLVGETVNYMTGLVTGSVRLAAAYAKGIESLPEAKAELILRSMKKGSIGAALLAVGYANYKSIGGFYHKGDKRDPEDVQPNRIKIGDATMPEWFNHTPPALVLQFGATVGRAENEYEKAEKKGLVEGAGVAALGLTKDIPFADAITRLAPAIESPHGFSQYFGEMAKSIATPAFLGWVAKTMDEHDKLGEPVRRTPSTFMEHLEMGIPGLREKVPLSKARKPSGNSFEGQFKGLGIDDALNAYEKAEPSQRAAVIDKLTHKYDRKLNQVDISADEITRLSKRFTEAMKLPLR